MTRPTSPSLRGLLAERDQLNLRIAQLETNLPKKAVAIERVLDVMRQFDISVEELKAAAEAPSEGSMGAANSDASAVQSAKASKAAKKAGKSSSTVLNPLPGQ